MAVTAAVAVAEIGFWPGTSVAGGDVGGAVVTDVEVAGTFVAVDSAASPLPQPTAARSSTPLAARAIRPASEGIIRLNMNNLFREFQVAYRFAWPDARAVLTGIQKDWDHPISYRFPLGEPRRLGAQTMGGWLSLGVTGVTTTQ